MYGSYCYAQYTDSVKSSNWYLVIALTYSLTANLLWVYLSKNMDQRNTLNYALLWDSGVHFTAFLIPVLIIGDRIKTHTAIGMGFIFVGISIVLFYEKINNFLR